MERSRYPIPQKNQIKITKRYLRESESGRYDELDEETVRPSRKGRVTTSHEPNFDYKRSNGNTRAHVAEYQDHIHYKRSGSRADSGYLEKSKEKPILDLNDQHIIYKERSREFKVDPSVKVAFEKPKKVHFQMRESKSTPPSVRVKAIKQKHGSNPTKYYTPSSYQQKQKYEKYGEHILDLEDGILSNDEGFKYSKHSNAKSLDYPRLHNDQYRRKASSYSQHPVDFSDSDNPSGSESDLEFYNRPYRSRRPQKFGKYSLYTSVPNNQVNDYNHIPSRIPRPASGMSGPQKSALKKSSSFNSRDKFSISKASRLNNILNNENLKNTNERKSVLLERPSSGKTMRSQVKNNRRYTPSTPGSPKKSVKYKPLMEDFESESSDGSSTDDSEPVEHKHGPSRTRKGSPATHENCYSVETSDSDSDEAFEQIEVYVPTAVFKHPPRQVYDHDQDYFMNIIHERQTKEYKRPERKKHNKDYLEEHDCSYKQSQSGSIYRMPVVVKRPESRSKDHDRISKMEKEQIEESRHRYEAPAQREQKQVEETDDGPMQGRRSYYRKPKSDKNASVETDHSYKKMELDDKHIRLFRKAEDSHRMFMSVWLPPRTSNGGSAKPKRSLLDTPEHLLMLRRIAKRS